jgi:RNA polymerase sigma factor (sigma-70 family)
MTETAGVSVLGLIWEEARMAFTTKKSLLAKVRAGDEISWREFYDTYRPLIYLVGRDCGLTPSENEELVQQVMCEIFNKDILGKYNIEEVPKEITFKYDPAKGRFRHYLKGIIRNQALKLYHKRGKFASMEDISEPAVEVNFDADWETEWKKHLFTQAMEELKNQVQAVTYSAFEMYAVQGRPVQDVADFLNLSVNSVYVAKNRCIAAIKNIIKEFEKK